MAEENKSNLNEKKKKPNVALAITMVIVIFFIVRACVNRDTTEKEQTNNKGKTASVGVINESCNVVSRKFEADSPLTQVQREESWESYKNKSFEWKLVAQDVQKETFGEEYNVLFKCINSRAFVSDITLKYPKTAEQKVKNIIKGKTYTTKGILTDYNTLTGLSGEAVVDGE